MITKERLEQEKSEAYIRGYVAAVEILSKKVVRAKDKLVMDLMNDKFQAFCDSHKSCQECIYTDLQIEDCQEYYIKEFNNEME